MYVEIFKLWLELDVQILPQAELQVEPWGENNRHSNDVSQRQRPTTSARRQWKAGGVAENAPHVDDVTEDVFQHAKEVVDDAESFLGGPLDPSVLTVDGDNVAIIVWNGEVFIIFNKL